LAASVKRRLARLGGWILGIAALLMPGLSVARAVAAYFSGTAELWYTGYPSRSGFNLDPDARVFWASRGCTLPSVEPLLVHLPNNATVRLLAAVFGPMRGTFHGPYPTPEEAAELLAGGFEIGPVPERSEWAENLDCEAVRALVQAQPDMEERARRCALYREQTLVLGDAREALLIERKTGRRYAILELPRDHVGQATAKSSATSTEPEAEKWLGEFAAYPAARVVCRQHVAGAGLEAPHIEWTLYATADATADVAAFYAARGGEARRGEAALTVADREGRKTLSVHGVGDSYPDCGVRPGPEARTVLVVSQLIGPPS
jgi:hypothetical protein